MLLKKTRNLHKIMPKGRSMFLAYDQGLEHGPIDFNDKNVDPRNIIEMAKMGKFTGLIFQKGTAEKYNQEIKKAKVPLIIKLNGKTSLVKGDPISRQLCTVEEAISLGASAVGYTIYIGSIHEEVMFREFEDIQRVAHVKGLPVIAWIYPRGKSLEKHDPGILMAYATRVGLELGADIIKIHPQGDLADLSWAVRSAGRAHVVIAGGAKTKEKELFKQIEDAIFVGASGVAIGRNVWQSKNPLEIVKKIRNIIFGR